MFIFMLYLHVPPARLLGSIRGGDEQPMAVRHQSHSAACTVVCLPWLVGCLYAAVQHMQNMWPWLCVCVCVGVGVGVGVGVVVVGGYLCQPCSWFSLHIHFFPTPPILSFFPFSLPVSLLWSHHRSNKLKALGQEISRSSPGILVQHHGVQTNGLVLTCTCVFV